MGKELNKDLEVTEAKATGEDSVAADPVVGAGGPVKKRLADLNKTGDVKPADVPNPVKVPQGTHDVGLKEALDDIFGEADLTEDFKTKTTTLFEAVIAEKARTIKEELEAEFEAKLAEEVETGMAYMVEKVNTYLDEVVETWMSDNEVALETNHKVSVAESLFNGIKGLLAENNIDIDEEQNNAIAVVEGKVEELTVDYNELFEELVRERAKNEDLLKSIALAEAVEGLVGTDAERLKMLSEDISYGDISEFTTKLETLKESNFSKTKKPTVDPTEMLEEEVLAEAAPVVAPNMSRYVDALNKFKK